jgi:hypothetical protein
MTNPFATDTLETAEVEDLDVEKLPAEEAEDTVAEDVAPAAEKAPKAKKGPARPDVPDGYIMPVAFARELTKHLAARGATNKHGKIDPETNPIPPQQIYSMMKTNSATGKNPFPVHSVDGYPSELLILEEALAWWDAKDERVTASKAAKAEKAAKKAAKADAKDAEDVTSDNTSVVEAE